jgi:hypothetical protein
MHNSKNSNSSYLKRAFGNIDRGKTSIYSKGSRKRKRMMGEGKVKGGLFESDDDEEDNEYGEDFDSLFEQETVYRYSKMLAHFTYKASVQGP